MIGFTSVSLRSYSVEEVVKAAEKAGAEIIEWGSDFHIKTVEDALKAKKLCDEIGLKINSYGTYFRTGCGDISEWKKICEIASLMGAEYIRTWLGEKVSEDTSEDEYLSLVKDAQAMADIAAEYNLVICHECHHHTYNDTTESSLRFIKDVNRENVRTYYQSWYRDEAGDKDKLFRLFPYVKDVHLSFSELVKFQKGYTEDKDFIIKILLWLKELNFSGGLIIEFTENDCAENLITDIKKLKELWAK